MKSLLRASIAAVILGGGARAALAIPFWLQLPEGVSSYAGTMDGLFYLILWITGIIFVLVEMLLLIFLFRYRHREGRRAHYTHGNNRLEVIWTILPAIICVVLALLSRRTWADIKQRMPEGALTVEVTAEQFAWNIRYPGPDGKLGTPDDVLSLNQMHVPVGRPVVVALRSKDVIHSFFLPEFRVKQDAVPGMTTRIWFDAMRTGNWEIACAELCGLGHYRMKGFLTVDTPEDFEKWLTAQAAQPETAASGSTPAPAAPSSTEAPPAGQTIPGPEPSAQPTPAGPPAPSAQEAKKGP